MGGALKSGPRRGVYAVRAILLSDEVSRGTRAWGTGLRGLALTFGVLTATLLSR